MCQKSWPRINPMSPCGSPVRSRTAKRSGLSDTPATTSRPACITARPTPVQAQAPTTPSRRSPRSPLIQMPRIGSKWKNATEFTGPSRVLRISKSTSNAHASILLACSGQRSCKGVIHSSQHGTFLCSTNQSCGVIREKKTLRLRTCCRFAHGLHIAIV